MCVCIYIYIYVCIYFFFCTRFIRVHITTSLGLSLSWCIFFFKSLFMDIFVDINNNINVKKYIYLYDCWCIRIIIYNFTEFLLARTAAAKASNMTVVVFQSTHASVTLTPYLCVFAEKHYIYITTYVYATYIHTYTNKNSEMDIIYVCVLEVLFSSRVRWWRQIYEGPHMVIYMCTYICAYACGYIHVHLSTYTHIHTRTYTHTYIHICT